MKTKNLILLLASLFCSLSLLAQTTTQQRSVSSFNKIAASAGIDVTYTISNQQSVKVEAETEIIDRIETVVENGTLIIKMKKDKKKWTSRTKLHVYVSAPTLEEVSVSGGSDFTAQEITNQNDIKFSASGGADIEVNKVTANQVFVNVSGGGDIDIANLTAKQCNVNASGGGDAEIKLNVTSCNAIASGGADITLKGKTQSINVNSSGGADVDISDLKYETINTNTSGAGKVKK